MYTNVTYRRNPGFFERVSQSLFGIIIGLVLMLVASGLLFWNEVSHLWCWNFGSECCIGRMKCQHSASVSCLCRVE